MKLIEQFWTIFLVVWNILAVNNFISWTWYNIITVWYSIRSIFIITYYQFCILPTNGRAICYNTLLNERVKNRCTYFSFRHTYILILCIKIYRTWYLFTAKRFKQCYQNFNIETWNYVQFYHVSNALIYHITLLRAL